MDILFLYISQESLDCSQHELEIKTLSIDSMTRTFDGQSAAQHDMATEKDALQQEVDVLRIKVNQKMILSEV